MTHVVANQKDEGVSVTIGVTRLTKLLATPRGSEIWVRIANR